MMGGFSSLFSGAPKADTSAAQAAARQAEEDRKRRAEEEAKLAAKEAEQAERDAALAKQNESDRLRKMQGMGSTIATGGAGLTDEAEVSKAKLKNKLGE
jgi:predicted flap endonuclease-1-like 5' DNA nuclease